jgi:hypothetical protein
LAGPSAFGGKAEVVVTQSGHRRFPPPVFWISEKSLGLSADTYNFGPGVPRVYALQREVGGRQNYRRTFDGIARFVDNKVEAPILIKKIQPIASCVFIESMLAQNRDLFLAHPNRNEGRLNIEPASDDSCNDAECALFKLHNGLGLRIHPPRAPQF